MRIACLAAALVVAAGTAAGADPLPHAYCAKDLVRMSRCELEALYRGAEIGCPPRGVTRGTAILNAGSKRTVPTSRVVRVLWQGKVISDDVMVNRVFGLRAVHARVYTGESWLDGRPSVIFDYAGASRLFPNVRDEVREIQPGLYLGVTHVRKDTGPEVAAFFVLEPRPNGLHAHP